MTIIHTIILSLIEGITEFLPISSTGHMILASYLLNISNSNFGKSFEIIIQMGAIFAVLFLYYKKIIRQKTMWLKILFAFLPSAITGFIFYKLIKQYLLGNPFIVVISLFIGGIVLLFIDKFISPKKQSISELTIKQSLIIGFFQTISMIPGVSRSAATIIGGLSTGLDRKEAVEFSFMLAIPTMAAATLLDLIKSSYSFTSDEIQMLVLGFIIAFITAYLTIKTFISYVQKNNFVLFGWYRIILSLVYWIFIL